MYNIIRFIEMSLFSLEGTLTAAIYRGNHAPDSHVCHVLALVRKARCKAGEYRFDTYGAR